MNKYLKQSGFSLIGVLLIIGALTITAGGVVWKERGAFGPIPFTTQTLTGTWKLVAYKNLITGEVEIEPTGEIERIPRYESVVIEFKDDGKKGEIKGHTVTNDIKGEYEILRGNKIKILRVATTLVFEPDWGKKFYDSIPVMQTSSYQIKGNSLLLYFNDGKELMDFVRQ